MTQQPSVVEATPLQSRRHSWPPGVSGNPSGTSKRFATLYSAMLAEFGELSVTDKTLLAHAVKMLLKAQRTKAPDDQVRLTNTATRVLVRLEQRKANAKPKPDLDAYLAKLRAEPA
jgi:hypothetical protein